MKPQIVGISRKEKRMQITFIKNESLIDLFDNLFEKFGIKLNIFHEFDIEKEKEINHKINSFSDRVFHFEDEHIKVELFIGSKKVILVIYSTHNVQGQMVEYIDNKCQWNN